MSLLRRSFVFRNLRLNSYRGSTLRFYSTHTDSLDSGQSTQPSSNVTSLGETVNQEQYPLLPSSSVQFGSFHPIAPDDSHLRNASEPSFGLVQQNLSLETFNAITVKPFTHKFMSPVQSALFNLLPDLIKPGHDQRKDLFIKSKTGTGKTLAFLVPAIESRINSIEKAGSDALAELNSNDQSLKYKAMKRFTNSTVGTVIISPTRELATQIANEAIKLSTHHKGFQVRLFVGGAKKLKQLNDFKNGRADIVVTTPGRMNDILQTSPLVRDAISTANQLILDEADTLLEMGFKDDITSIVDYLPGHPQRQSILLSATLSNSIRSVAKSILKPNHLFIDTVPEGESNSHKHIPQYYTTLPDSSHQLPHLLKLISHDQLIHPKQSKIILFCPTTKMTMLYSTLLRALSQSLPNKSNVYEIHSKRTMEQRSKASDNFRKDKSSSSILVTSDVSARGVDYPNVSRVIQIGIPHSSDQYVHRIGRTGRGENKLGRADIILDYYELPFLTWQLTQMEINENPIKNFNKELIDLAKDQKDLNAIDKVEKLDYEVNDLISQIDELAVRETFASLLGYYLPKAGVLRTTKGVVIEGLKSWCMKGMGLKKAPYVSDLFLQKLGLTDNRSKKFGVSDRYVGPESAEYLSVGYQNTNKDLGQRYKIEGKTQYRGPDRQKFRSEWDKRNLYGYRGQGPPPESEKYLPELDADEYRGAPYGRPQHSPEARDEGIKSPRQFKTVKNNEYSGFTRSPRFDNNNNNNRNFKSNNYNNNRRSYSTLSSFRKNYQHPINIPCLKTRMYYNTHDRNSRVSEGKSYPHKRSNENNRENENEVSVRTESHYRLVDKVHRRRRWAAKDFNSRKKVIQDYMKD